MHNAGPAVHIDHTERMKPAEELAMLSARLAAGTATDEDKTRLRELAA